MVISKWINTHGNRDILLPVKNVVQPPEGENKEK